MIDLLKTIQIGMHDPWAWFIFIMLVAAFCGVTIAVYVIHRVTKMIRQDSVDYEINKMRRCEHKFERVTRCAKCGYIFK